MQAVSSQALSESGSRWQAHPQTSRRPQKDGAVTAASKAEVLCAAVEVNRQLALARGAVGVAAAFSLDTLRPRAGRAAGSLTQANLVQLAFEVLLTTAPDDALRRPFPVDAAVETTVTSSHRWRGRRASGSRWGTLQRALGTCFRHGDGALRSRRNSRIELWVIAGAKRASAPVGHHRVRGRRKRRQT